MNSNNKSDKLTTIYTYKDFLFAVALLTVVIDFAWKFSFDTTRQELFETGNYLVSPFSIYSIVMVALYFVWSCVHSKQNKPR